MASPRPLLLATSNKGKIIEIRESLGGIPHALVTLGDIDHDLAPPEETGETFRENALLKARHYAGALSLPAFADDSGIIVDALKGELGIHTRRWGAGPAATDEEWIAYFLRRMEREENRRASFVCAIAYVDAAGREHHFEGRCDGVITPSLEADYLPGLPISGCFKPDGYEHVFSALSIEQKNSTSHRGRAVEKLKAHLLAESA